MRPAVIIDVPQILLLLTRMHGESRWARFELDTDKMAKFIVDMIINPAAIVLVAGEPPHGVLIGLVQELWFSQDKTAFEVTFYVAPEKRGSRAAMKLLQGYKEAAIERGAKEVKISEEAGIAPEQVEHFYAHMGFIKLGTAFLME